MRIHLVDDDEDFKSALVAALSQRAIAVLDPSQTAASNPEKPKDSSHLIILGETREPLDIAHWRQVCWPTPIAVLLTETSPHNAMLAGRAGALGVYDRAAPVSEIADWIRALGNDCVGDGTSKTASSHYFHSDSCRAMQALDEMILRVATTDSTVLIVGETGTGKELAARQVHASSVRSARPIISVNCAAIPETLIESELFGYEKGAFTGATSNRIGLIEAADGGTLFLDEIGELPLAAQARLLRFIQEGEIRQIGSVSSKKVDVRLICATHRDLARLADEKAFRHDLFYRIDVLRLDIPPLRSRGQDILEMANWFRDQLADKLNIPARPFSLSSERLINDHHWPGNVREMQNVIERALVMSDGPTLQIALPAFDQYATDESVFDSGASTGSSDAESNEELSLEDYFQRFVLQHQDAMNETELAQKLGISRKCLWERRQRFGIPRQKQKSA